MMEHYLQKAFERFHGKPFNLRRKGDGYENRATNDKWLIFVAGALAATNQINPKGETTMSNLIQFFTYQHLPEHLQKISKPFSELASVILESTPANPEQTVALRKLLEAKDCAVRAVLWKETA